MTTTLQTPPAASSLDGTRKKQRTPSLPLVDEHADVALVDIRDIKVLTRMSSSWIHEAVRTGDFPAPVIRRPKCTRWTIASVRAWLKQQAQTPDPEASARVIAQANRATKAAQAKRRAAQAT